MTGKELIKKAMRLEETERTPWVPFVGVHGAKLIGETATNYLHSTDLIIKGANEAIKLYQPDGIPVLFDLQIEAEALGCKLAWSENNPPAVVSHPLSEGKDLKDLHCPTLSDGRIALAKEVAKILRKQHPEIALYGLVTGPFTLALHLLGTEIFIKMMEDPDYVTALFDFTEKVARFMADIYLDEGCDVIAMVDPMTSQIDPYSFETFVSPSATRLFDHIRERGALSSFFVCGNAQQNIEAMCKCKPDNISIDENIPLSFVKDIALPAGVSFGGNMKLTTVLLMGTVDDSKQDTIECMDAGGHKGFILAPGCDLPMDTPPENLKAVATLVHDPYQLQIARTMVKKDKNIETLNLHNHWKPGKAIIDVITLDSSSCAPCQYMVEAVKNACLGMEDKVEWHEHKIKEKEGIQMMATLGVKNIPTICINGKVEFISNIPPKQELIKAIKRHLEEK